MDEKVDVNEVKSFCAILKRSRCRIYHHFSSKRLQRYVNEFMIRHNTISMKSDERFGCLLKVTVGGGFDARS
ncbi:transposase [Bartonella sp. CB60]|uniref:transposase n=1 Tax=Bartonella sp. CB60 TaxID=3113619 RepID=UPI003FA565C5